MAKKWCVYDVELQEEFLREHRGRGFAYQYARGLAVTATKRYDRKFEPRVEEEEGE